MDDKKKTRILDSKEINIHETYEVEYWTKTFDVTKAQLKAAINAAGTSVAAVKKHLKK